MRIEEEEKKKLKVEEEMRARERAKKEELKAIIKEIQEEVQAKVNVQVAAMIHTFLGDFGLLLRHLLRGGKTGDLDNERTMETTKALQVLQHFDLGESDSESESEMESDSDSEQSDSSEEGTETRTGRYRGMNPQHSNACQCGKVVRQYQRGSSVYYISQIIN